MVCTFFYLLDVPLVLNKKKGFRLRGDGERETDVSDVSDVSERKGLRPWAESKLSENEISKLYSEN